MEIREGQAHHGISVWSGFQRKAAVTEKFLKELFEGKTLETPAMKYGLTYQIRAAKPYLDSGNNTKLYKSGLVVNPAFC